METDGGAAAVCVLGMSRSGTSLTARVLSLAGVCLGPEEELLGRDLRQLAGEGEAVLARARDANPDGFFEHYRLVRLNERVLKALGGNWREPPDLPAGWEASEALAGEREEARALLAQSFEGRPLWAWKDPRNCLTLPFWQALIPNMRYVICLRNPLDVAGSLQRRDGLSLERALSLWSIYVARALTNTSGRPRLLLPYESYFQGRDAVAARLARFAGRGGALEGSAARQGLTEAVDERLWRHRSSSSDLIEDDRVSPEVTSLYLLTEMLAAAAPEGGEGRRDDLHADADLYAEKLLAGLSLPPGATAS